MGKVLVFGSGFVGLIWALYSALCVVVVAPQIAAPVVVEIAAQPIPPQPTLAPVLPWAMIETLGSVRLADVGTMELPTGEQVGLKDHAEVRHTKEEADEVRAFMAAYLAAHPIFANQPPCDDGRYRFVAEMAKGVWAVWVMVKTGDRMYDERTAFKSYTQDYATGVRDDCGERNRSYWGHSYAQ